MGHEYAASTFIMNSSYNGTHLAEVTAEDRMPKFSFHKKDVSLKIGGWFTKVSNGYFF